MFPVINVGLLFTELPWAERFAAVAEAGHDRVEFPWPSLPPGEVTRLVRAAGVRVALLNMDAGDLAAGDLAAGDRGYGNDPRLTELWRLRLRQALDLAAELDCPLVNVLAGRLLPEPDRAHQVRCLIDNLRWAAGLAARTGRTLVVEPINDRDVPGYLVPRVTGVLELLGHVDHDGVALQLDAYHVAAMGDELTHAIEAAGDRIRHVQVAGFPGRHEPGAGELDRLLAALAGAGYAGGIGLEYLPTRPSAASLRAVTARHPLLRPYRERTP